jgi:Flp pilus assembly protein TadB
VKRQACTVRWTTVPTCSHGFDQSECLICKTLGTAPAQSKAGQSKAGQSKATKTKVASPLSTAELAAVPASTSLATRGTTNGAREPGRERRGPGFFWMLLAGIVVAALVIWAFWGVVSLAFHVAEYVLIALVAGWIGYKIGHARGRHSQRAITE